jgi:DNA polymerase-3 subunit delta'
VLVAESTDKMLSTIISRTQLVKIRTISNGFQNVSDEFRSLYVTWMRQLFKLNMASLSAWVDTMNSKSREVQKQFLLFAQESIRDSFLCNNAGLPSQIDFGDEKFNASFPAMITERNIELLNNAFNEAIFAIERNAYGKIAFMELSFRISKALKKR